MKFLKENGWVILFMFLSILIVLFFTDHHINSDALQRFAAINLLMEKGEFSKMSYSMIGPLFSIPLWLLGKIVKTPEWWLARYNLFLFAAFLLSGWFILKDLIDRKVLLLSLLLLGSFSLFVPYQKNYMGEIFTASLCGIGIFLLSKKKEIGWMPLIVGTANTPATLVGLGMISLYKIIKERKLRYAVYPILAVSLICLESYIRRGGFLSLGYEDNHGFETLLPFSGLSGFSYPFVLGLISILFSFGKGLIFFFPGLWLLSDLKKIRKDNPLYEIIILSCLFLIGEILVYSKWWAWYGGSYWGPRFFLLASIPAAFLVANSIVNAKAQRFWKNTFVLLILVFSTWIVINGTVFDQSNLSVCSENNFQYEFLCWYVPEFSVLIRPFIDPSFLSTDNKVFIVYMIFSFIYLALPLLKVVLPKIISSVRLYISEIKSFRI